MKHLYMCNSDKIQPRDSEFQIREEKPGLFRAYPKQKLSVNALITNMYWWLVTGGEYRVWCAYANGSVIHTSYVIPKCKKFPFLDSGSYEIGPCYTDAGYRGKGIYPSVLYKIVVCGGGVLLT